MECLLSLVLFAVILLPQYQGMPSVAEEPRASSQQTVTVEDISKSASLAQVLAEYLADIEIVEAAASRCSKGHRERHRGAAGHLEAALIRCESSEGGGGSSQGEAVRRCVERATEGEVSDLRQRITDLKTCVDSVG